MKRLKPGDRVKVVDHDHPAYGRVGDVEQVVKSGVLVRFDHYPLASGVALKGLRRVNRAVSA